MSDPSGWTLEAPFTNHLGVKIISCANGEMELEFNARSELTNRKGGIHGGVLSSLIDIAASEVTRSLGDLKGVATINLAVSFIAPAEGKVTVKSKILQAGRSTSFVDVKIFNAGGELAATGSVTLRIIR